ncbi:MAG: hypothetical protein WD696_23105 [Bryobacteraceae bacterium]
MKLDEFSLAQGGLIYALQKRITLAATGQTGVVQQSLVFVSITWAPLLILSLVQGVALGTRVDIPFLRDFLVNVRFLVALPILIVAAIFIDPSVRHAVNHFVTSELVPSEEMARFEDVITKTMKLRDSAIATTLLVATAFAPSLWPGLVDFATPGMSSWHFAPQGEDTLSLAGWWFLLISIPVYRVLLLHWFWLMIVWATLLWRISKIELRCIPSHPDGAGGLDFLAHTQRKFAIVGMAASAIIAGGIANSIAYHGRPLSDYKYLIPAVCALLVIGIAAPVLVMRPQLLRVKRKGLLEYGVLGSAYAGSFQNKWVNEPPLKSESLLGTADIQSLADLAGSYEVVRDMRTILIDMKAFLRMALVILLPTVPLLLVIAPAEDILKLILKILG